MNKYLVQAQELFPYTQALRRDLHKHPELGFKEVRTAGIVARELQNLDLDVHTGIAHTGVTALLNGVKPRPVVMLRFDMDALPIQETTGADYASVVPGVMHACGHDGHVAVGLTVAKLLTNLKNELPGAVKFIFQPAEEGLGGAQGMIDAGVLNNPKPDYALGVHIWNDMPLGWIGITPGPLMAAADIFSIEIIGRGGHGALPHHAIDPLIAASQIHLALQTIVSREVSPLETAVVSVTTIHGGEAFNVIPSQVTMQGTIRTFKPKIRNEVIERFQQIVRGVANAQRCQVNIEIDSLTTAVVNDPWVSDQVVRTAKEIFPKNIIDQNFQTMGSEDMSNFLDIIPGCFIFMGSANAEKGLVANHHHSAFDFDEEVLPNTAALITAAVFNLLEGHR